MSPNQFTQDKANTNHVECSQSFLKQVTVTRTPEPLVTRERLEVGNEAPTT